MKKLKLDFRVSLKKAAHPARYAVAGMRCGATVSSKPSCPGSCHDHSGDWPDTLHISCFLMCRLGAQKTVVLSRVCFRHPPHPGSNRDTASVAWQRCPAVTPAVCHGKRPNPHHLSSLRRLRAGHSFPSATSLPQHHAIRHPVSPLSFALCVPCDSFRMARGPKYETVTTSSSAREPRSSSHRTASIGGSYTGNETARSKASCVAVSSTFCYETTDTRRRWAVIVKKTSCLVASAVDLGGSAPEH